MMVIFIPWDPFLRKNITLNRSKILLDFWGAGIGLIRQVWNTQWTMQYGQDFFSKVLHSTGMSQEVRITG